MCVRVVVVRRGELVVDWLAACLASRADVALVALGPHVHALHPVPHDRVPSFVGQV